MLDAGEREQVLRFVAEQRPLWSARSPHAPFFTLGAAAYLDGQYERDPRQYHLRAQRLNKVLRAGLGWLYDRLLETLMDALEDRAVYYSPRLALPGFHVFLAHPKFELPVCSVHVDRQYEHIRWGAGDRIDPSRTISFTASIALPKAGGGLNIWDVEKAQIENATQAQIDGLLAERRRELFTYEPGRMVVHGGHLVHQIAAVPLADAGDQRITLQGHAIHSRYGWQVYW